MRIAIDARAAAEVPAGRGRYVRELLRALADLDADHAYDLLARERWGGAALDERFRWREVGAGEPQWALHAARAARGADAVLATNSYLLAALARRGITTVYDLVPFAPELGAPRASAVERVTLPLAIRRAATPLCISEATRAELVAEHPRAARTARVVPLGVEPRFFAGADEAAAVRSRHGLERPYLLALGTLEPRKNLPRTIEAVAGLPPELRDRCELVLAGPRGWRTEPIDAALARHAATVRWLGHVADDDLPGLYAGAELFLYPSLHEGFGLPVLEAMAAGTPVVTADGSSLPEVGGDAVRYVDPRSVAAIRAAVAGLLQDAPGRAALAAAGRARARTFTWERTARETLAVVEDRARGGGGVG